MSQNLVEKIVQKYAIGLKPEQKVHTGDFVSIQPAHILTHDNTGAVMQKFEVIGGSQMANPRQPMFALDHNVQDKSEANLKKYAGIEAFAKKMGVDFYPAGRGIGHQIMVEEGYAFPGSMAVASDSHANMYGGIGCLGTPVVRTDAAAIWATGQTWWQIPPVAKINLTGQLKPGVTGKDVIITLAGYFNQDEVLNHVLEFSGNGLPYLSVNDRLTIANMTTEWGALAGLFPIDDRTIQWLEDRAEFIANRGLAGVPSDSDGNGAHPRLNSSRIDALKDHPLQADQDARYGQELTLDLSTVRPHVSGPNHVKTTTRVADMEKKNIRIDKAYLVSCVNSRVEDIAAAAEVVRGKKVADHVEFYIAAASSEVQADAEARGDWQALVDAGARPLPPGCGPCIGLGVGLLEDGEVGISATNRNFKGRMGSREAEAYLASPQVVAASAVAGKISGATAFEDEPLRASIEVFARQKSGEISVELIDNFDPVMEGKLIFCPQDNLNTDGIFPGKYTYIDDFTPEQQAGVVMENYDPEFGEIARDGDILVGGFNFGTGSSREQAATALKYKGLQCVLAGSFSQTYKRNALNNGYIVLETPDLVSDLVSQFGTEKLTYKTGLYAHIDFGKATITIGDKEYDISPLGSSAQELIVAGGLENWVKEQIHSE